MHITLPFVLWPGTDLAWNAFIAIRAAGFFTIVAFACLLTMAIVTEMRVSESDTGGDRSLFYVAFVAFGLAVLNLALGAYLIALMAFVATATVAVLMIRTLPKAFQRAFFAKKAKLHAISTPDSEKNIKKVG